MKILKLIKGCIIADLIIISILIISMLPGCTPIRTYTEDINNAQRKLFEATTNIITSFSYDCMEEVKTLTLEQLQGLSLNPCAAECWREHNQS